jgi:hypothetical protein
MNVLDFSLPFTFSFSNAGASYTQPFNISALHPKYKDWQAHVGITSMTLSPYTYGGLNFAGGGIEYTPKKWKLKAFGGRLRKAIEYDPTNENINNVSYRRWGFGLSTAYTGKKFNTEFILFKGFDDAKSLTYYHNNPTLTAQDNLVASVKSKVNIIESLSVSGEFASSLLTRDILVSPSAENQRFYHSLIQGNQSSVISNAYNGSIDYRLKFANIGAKYERIDPHYSSLGAIYFNNDIENVTLNPSFVLFKKKLSVSGSIGYQRNNLDQNNTSDVKRWIGNVALTAQLAKGLNLSGNYSNLSSFTRRNPAADPFYTVIGDTLNYYQVSQNINSSLVYAFGDSIKHALNLTGTFAQSENITGRLDNAEAFGFNVEGNEPQGLVDVYNTLFSHRITFPTTKLSIGYTVNANHTVTELVTNTYIGPGVNIGKSFKKKTTLSAGLTYNQQLQNRILQNHVVNSRIGIRMNPSLWDKKYGKVSLGINGTWTNRLPVNGANSSQIITVMANIGYQF